MACLLEPDCSEVVEQLSVSTLVHPPLLLWQVQVVWSSQQAALAAWGLPWWVVHARRYLTSLELEEAWSLLQTVQ